MRPTRIYRPPSPVISIALATALAVTICLAPVATADPPPLAQAEAAIAATHAERPATILRVVAPNDSFNWTDAGIGAGAVLVLAAFGLAGARGVRSRKRHGREQRAIATS